MYNIYNIFTALVSVYLLLYWPGNVTALHVGQFTLQEDFVSPFLKEKAKQCNSDHSYCL